MLLYWKKVLKIIIVVILAMVLIIFVGIASYQFGYKQASFLGGNNTITPTPTYAKYLPNRKGYAHE